MCRIGDGPLSGLGSSVKPCFSSLKIMTLGCTEGSAKASAYLRWLCSIVPCWQHLGLGGALRSRSALESSPPDARTQTDKHRTGGGWFIHLEGTRWLFVGGVFSNYCTSDRNTAYTAYCMSYHSYGMFRY